MFYLIEITTKADKVEKGIYSYDTRNDAVANFHTKMGGAMKNEGYLAEMLMVIGEMGDVVTYSYYQKPGVTPEEGE